MTLDELRGGMPPMPESCKSAIVHTLGTLPDMPRASTPRWRLIPLAAALLLLALAGVSFSAANPQILRWLLGGDTPSAALEQLAQPLDVTAESGGIAVTLTGAACDGNQLSLSWQIENAEPESPALIYLQSAALDGQDILRLSPDAAQLDARWSPSFHLDALPAARNPLEAGTTLFLPDEPAEGALATLSFAVLRPVRALAVCDERMGDSFQAQDEAGHLELQDVRETLLRFEGLRIAPADDLDADTWLKRGFLPIDLSGSILLPDGMDEGRAFDELFEQETVLSLSFTLSASPEAVLDLTPDAPIPLSACSAVIDALALSPLSTRLSLALIPEENTEAAARALLDSFGEVFLGDEAGNSLVYLEMDFLSSGAGQVQRLDGQWLCRYALDLPGVCALPRAIQVTLKGSAGEETIFTAKL